ncbi:MAG: AAA family ATPase, partial [Bacteroidetes bacterium]|nr:AAA family ATPase [Bacteroidota bacterium]
MNIQEDATLLHEGDSSLLYIANLPEYGGKVILKLPKELLNKDAVLQLENEYSMLRQFSSPRIRHVIGKAEINHRAALLMKYIEGLNLKDYLKQYRPDFSERLIIAVSLCQLLEEVHSQNILHGNFCSNNIIVHPAILSTTLIDFKLASPVPQAVQEADVVSGPALHYMAPELSGKASGTADERADLYSLGVVLYELFAEVLPFTAEDPQALIHAHLAVDPPPLQQQAPAIPQTLAEIVHKLLNKSPETRYQTAAGVQADFEQCIALQEQKGEISPFKIACFDSVARLRLPNALIGREAETQQLRMVWKRVSSGAAEVFWIAGQAGIGKTSLAGQVKIWAKKARGQVAYGKFDLLSGSKPYDGLVQALNGLMELLLTKDEDEVTHGRSCIQQAVGREGKLLTDLLPRLRLLLGNQPPLAPLDGPEAQHRFHYVFRNFLKALAAAEHPLVLQLDDLQWADAATLAFLQELLNDSEFNHFLFIGIYRAEEARENYRLLQLLQQQAAVLPVHKLVLANMEIEEVNSFLAETFQESSPAIHQLATVLYAKTKGNPLFITQFLRTIYQQKLLWLELAKGSAAKGRWAWDLEKIAQLPQTENVLILIISRFNQLDEETQFLLQAAACMGNQFDRNVLLEITGKNIRYPLSVLSRAMQEGYITKLSNGESSIRLPVYRFL